MTHHRLFVPWLRRLVVFAVVVAATLARAQTSSTPADPLFIWERANVLRSIGSDCITLQGAGVPAVNQVYKVRAFLQALRVCFCRPFNTAVGILVGTRAGLNTSPLQLKFALSLLYAGDHVSNTPYIQSFNPRR
jgi:hypothetical protein